MAVIAKHARTVWLASASTLLAAVLLGAGVSCVTDKEGARGTACDRAGDCADGLFCVQGTCNDDLSKLDGGKVSTLLDTAGETPVADAPAEAGDAEPIDTAPAPDTGVPPTDTGTPTDTTTPPKDTTPPPTDTTPPPTDTTPPPTDTTAPPTDTASGD